MDPAVVPLQPERGPRPDRFVVRPGGPLEGTVRAGGAKNSALKLMAACLLAEGRHELTNVPRIVDVEIMSDVLRCLGATVDRPADGRLLIDTPAPDRLVPEAPYELVERMRASIVVLGPLLARCGRASVSLPGGDDFGTRPIDIHLSGLGALGVRFETVHGQVVGRFVDDDGRYDGGDGRFVDDDGRYHGGDGRYDGDSQAGGASPAGRPRLDEVGGALHGTARRLVGTRVVLEYPSHTATDNLLMAAVLAKGTTVIENAAREPEVCDLARFLVKMGARIEGIGTSHLEVQGVEELRPTRYSVVPDRVVATTYLAAVGLAGGEVVVEDARADHMEMLVRKLSAMGVAVEQRPAGLAATSRHRLRSVDVATLPYPGVATDYKPFLVTMLTVADSVGIVSENLFSGRFRYVDELRRMGADVRTEGHHAVVRGVPRLSGAPVKAPDIRAGAALVLAGLVAEGETVVSEAWHVDRGYEDLAAGLASLGAWVERR